MPRFTANQNKKFWDLYALKSKDSPIGAHSDRHIVEFANNFFSMVLKSIKPRSLLDVGCGNCQRTIFFSKYVKGKTLGIDYSDKMIDYAKIVLSRQKKSIGQKVSFEVQDIQNYSNNKKYDVIISCRTFVNQPTCEDQVRLFKKLHSRLNKNGSLLIAEISEEGNASLIDLRKKHGLSPTKPRNRNMRNLYISEKKVFSKISNLFETKEIRRGGVFYYITRIIHPVLVYPAEPKANAKINDIGLKSEFIMQDELRGIDNPFEKFGEHILAHFVKK